MITQKTRRHSGRITPGIFFDGMGKNEIIENCLEPQVYWNDWKDYRNGLRFNKDRKFLRNKFINFSNRLEIKNGTTNSKN